MGSGKETMDRLRERIYFVVLLFATVGASHALIANELSDSTDPVVRSLLIGSVLFLLLQVWALRSASFGVRAVAGTLYLAVAVIVLSTIAYSLYLQPSQAYAQVSLISLYSWLPLVYASFFLMYESRAAVVRSGILYMLILCVSVPKAVATMGSSVPFEGFNAVSQVYFTHAGVIAVLFFFTRLRGQLARTQAVADQMRELAWTDVLTGISNRRQIEEVLSDETARSLRYGQPLSVILFDLDDFKSLNDDLGHDAGDRALVAVTRLIEPHLRATDHLARWGGEEFLIVATETPVEAAGLLADRVRSAVTDYPLEGERHVSASFGVAAYHPGDAPSDLIKRADVALYRAKALGKNRVEREHAA